MSIQIRRPTVDDIPAIVKLMRDFAEFENLGEYFEVTEERLHDAMFGEDAFVECLMGFDRGVPIAYAMFYPYFASFRGQRGYYLEDIFISDAHRGRGVGEALLREVARLGLERGFERIDFQVLEWNMPAVKFYERLGAVHDEEERHFKFTDAAFRSLAS